MRGLFIFILILFIDSLCFSQQENKTLEAAIAFYENYDYKEATQNFKIASDLFLENGNVKNYLISQLYISKIEIYKNKFPLALQTIDLSIKAYNSSKIRNDSLWGELMNTKALIYSLDGDIGQAIKISDKILDEQLKIPTLPKYNLTTSYTVRSHILVLLNKPDESIAVINKVLGFSDTTISALERAILYDTMGSAYVHKDDFDQAALYYNKAHQLNIKYKAKLDDLALTSFHLGIISEYFGDYNKAVKCYKKSVHYIQQNKEEETVFISKAYTALSNAYKHKNDLEKAEEYIEKALQKSRNTFHEDHFNMAHIYASYSRILKSLGKLEESLSFDKKTQRIRENTYGLYNRFSIQNLKSIARTHVDMGNYDDALKYYEEILRRTQKMKSKTQQAHCYSDLGVMYSKKREHKKATSLFDKGLVLLSENSGTHFRQTMSMELSLARSLFDEGNHKRALKIIRKHFELNNNKKHEYPSLLLEAIDIDTKIRLITYKKGGTLDGLKNSYKNIELLITCTNDIKKEYTRQRSQIDVSNKSKVYFERGIEVCYILYQNTKEQQYLIKAFELSEINRNSTLTAGIKDVQFKKMANIPDSLLRQERSIKKKLSKVKKAIYRKEKSSGVDTLMSLRIHYGLQLDSVLSKIELEYPKYYRLKYANKTISIPSLQNKYLTADTTFIEYYLGEDATYVFEIHKGYVSFRKIEATITIRKYVEEFRKKMISQQDIEVSSGLLFDILLRESNLTKRIVLVADGVLNYLPFEVLMKDQEYLIENHSISYVGSATILQEQKEIVYQKKEPWIGFAPEYDTWNSLAASQKEIEAIAELMNGKSLIGKEATLRNFKKHIGDFSIIHLAAHAKIDNYNPMFNNLLFANDTLVAGNELTASEVYTLYIPSELIILGACDTGFGKLEKGEGVMSMSRAFHYAGAKSTVMSLWKVPDKETSMLMKSFYKNLKKGFSKDESLQLAKLKYINNTKDNLLKHPYYWAGFVVSGNMEAIQSEKSYWWILVIAALGLLLVSRRKLLQFFK